MKFKAEEGTMRIYLCVNRRIERKLRENFELSSGEFFDSQTENKSVNLRFLLRFLLLLCDCTKPVLLTSISLLLVFSVIVQIRHFSEESELELQRGRFGDDDSP
jgi:hypothetical protein